MENRKELFAKEDARFREDQKKTAETFAPVADMLNLDKKKVEEAVSKTLKDIQKMCSQEAPPFKSE